MQVSSSFDRVQPPFHRRWGRVLIVVGLVIVVGFGFLGAAAWGGWFRDGDVEVGVVATAAPDLTAEERAYYDFMAPRLRELGAPARELAHLGETRSRDILALQAHAERLTELSKEIDGFAAANGTPVRFATVESRYRDGVRLARRAMAEARRGILTVDWDQVGRAVAVFVAGAEELEQAVVELDVAGGMATPGGAVTASPVRYSGSHVGTGAAPGRLWIAL